MESCILENGRHPTQNEEFVVSLSSPVSVSSTKLLTGNICCSHQRSKQCLPCMLHKAERWGAG